jgi:sensor histidine kinase YesM
MEFYPVHFFWHIAVATLFLMSLYSFIIGVRTNLKAFHWYFIYSFFLLIYVASKSFYFAKLGTGATLLDTLITVFEWFIQVVYNCAYMFFFIYLLDVKEHLPKFANFIAKSVKGLFLLSLATALLSVIINNQTFYIKYFHFVFIPIISLLSIVVLFKLWKIPGYLKIYFFIGGLSYMCLALTASIMSWTTTYDDTDTLGDIVAMVYFYWGVIIEQICFGFALGYFADQLNLKYHLTMTQNMNLKNKHNEELTIKLKDQSRRLEQLAQEAKEKKVALVKSEYESKLNESRLSSLQSKMNPHFIFNALNSIKAYLIENDKSKAVDYMNRFSKLVRKILESSRIESISLKEELEILELYIEIENTRFNNEIFFSLENNASQNDMNIKIPPLILQPFVENALWHGLAPIEKDKKLCINILKVRNSIKIEIEDNGVGRKQSSLANKSKLKKKSMGMKISKERLWVFNQKFKTDYYFEIKDKLQPETGTIVTLYFN